MNFKALSILVTLIVTVSASPTAGGSALVKRVRTVDPIYTSPEDPDLQAEALTKRARAFDPVYRNPEDSDTYRLRH